MNMCVGIYASWICIVDIHHACMHICLDILCTDEIKKLPFKLLNLPLESGVYITGSCSEVFFGLWEKN